MGFSMTESKANFIFVKLPGFDAFELYVSLKEKGILVRHWRKPRISDFLRITIGTKDQMDKLLTAIEEIVRRSADRQVASI